MGGANKLHQSTLGATGQQFRISKMKTAITCFIIFMASLMVLWSGHHIIAGITAAISGTICILTALFTNTK